MDVHTLVSRLLILSISKLSRALVCVVAQPFLFESIKDYWYDSFYWLILKDTICKVVLRR